MASELRLPPRPFERWPQICGHPPETSSSRDRLIESTDLWSRRPSSAREGIWQPEVPPNLSSIG